MHGKFIKTDIGLEPQNNKGKESYCPSVAASRPEGCPLTAMCPGADLLPPRRSPGHAATPPARCPWSPRR